MWGKQFFAAALAFGVGITIAFAESPTQSDVSSWEAYRTKRWVLRQGIRVTGTCVRPREQGQKPSWWRRPLKSENRIRLCSFGFTGRLIRKACDWPVVRGPTACNKAVPPPATNTSISGRPAVRMKAVGVLGQNVSVLHLIKQARIFEITITQPSSQTQLDRTYQGIVSSVRFID
jgi:hypothetical protein